MVAALLDAAGLDPTVVNGGIINAYGTNARLGQGDWMVVEADESDGSFLRLPATVAVVTNIDPEHLDHYGDFEAVRDAFQPSSSSMPFYGFAVLCIDHPEVQALIGRVTDRRVVTYGFSPQADVRAVDTAWLEDGGAIFDVVIRAKTARASRRLARVAPADARPAQRARTRWPPSPWPASWASPTRPIRRSAGRLRRRQAPLHHDRRRSTASRIIDDYGHHPVEIAAVLRTARAATAGRVIAVVQPHRYTRLRDLFEEFCTCFNDADTVIVAAVYAAGEAPIEGVDRDALVEGLRRHGHRDVRAARRPGRPGRRWSPRWPGPATSWSASAPAASPTGPTPCPSELAALATGAGAAGMTGWRDRAAAGPRHAAPRRAAGAAHLAPRRRAGRGAVPAGGRRRLAAFLAPLAAGRAGDRRSASASEPAGPRRRRRRAW